MQRRTAIRVIGSAILTAVAAGCASTTGGQPTAVVTSPTSQGASVPWDGIATTTRTTDSSVSTSTAATTDSPTPTATTSTGLTLPVTPPDLSGGVTGSITWNTGSMPPPYNYSWTVEFTATSGTFTLHTNYASDNQSWSQEFPVTPAMMAALTAALGAAGVGAEGPPSDEHLVGGSTGSYRLTTADGTELHASLGDSSATSTELKGIAGAVEVFVGAAIWNSAMDSYQKWASEHP